MTEGQNTSTATAERPLIVLGYPRIDFQANYHYAWVPYSLLFIADALVEQGLVDVVVYDANQDTRSWEGLLRENQNRLLCVGFSIMTGGQQISHAIKLAQTLADIAPGVPRVFGGPHANVLPSQTAAHPLVTHVLTGPGQYTMPSLVSALLGLSPIEGVPDLWRHVDDEVLPPAQHLPIDWSLGPVRHWNLLPLECYVRADEAIAPRTLNYLSSYGCRYRCRFCYEQHYVHHFHALPAQVVLADIAGLVDRLDLSGIKFYDANLFMDKPRAMGLMDGLGRLSPKLSWAASIHPNDIRVLLSKDPNTIHRLHAAGCRRLLIGVESGDDRVLREIVRKGVDREGILAAARAVDAAEIIGAYTFILGFPGETREEKQRTIDMAEQIAYLPTRPEVRFHGYAPYPGTPLYEDAVNAGFQPPGSLEGWAGFDYYSMRTPWLDDTDLDVIRRWSHATGRRLKEPETHPGSTHHHEGTR